jgi:hypothetical protein
MAYATRVSTSAASAGLNAILALLTSGSVLKVFSSSQPATPDILPAAQDLLATLSFSTTPFGAAVAGVSTANAIAATTVERSGTATWFRISSTAAGYPTSSGYGLIDGTASTAGSNMILNSASLSSGASLTISALTITQPQTTA